MNTDHDRPDAAMVSAAVDRLRAGGIVVLPTETVYGLAADAENPAAVAAVFALKGRPADHPLIVHIGSAGLMHRYAREVPAAATELAERFWPGPLTLVLRRTAKAADGVTGGQDTVAMRVPAHPLALAVLTAFGHGLAAPSANRFGHVSPTTAAHVRAEFGAAAPMILDGGPCRVGIESTIVDLTGASPRVLRPGDISAPALSAALGLPVATGPAADSPRVSGALRSHYAPRAQTRLVDAGTLPQARDRAQQQGLRVQIMSLTVPLGDSAGVAMPPAAADYARHLYAALRLLDERADLILVETPPASAPWDAVRDRLQRAAAGRDKPPDGAG